MAPLPWYEKNHFDEEDFKRDRARILHDLHEDRFINDEEYQRECLKVIEDLETELPHELALMGVSKDSIEEYKKNIGKRRKTYGNLSLNTAVPYEKVGLLIRELAQSLDGKGFVYHDLGEGKYHVIGPNQKDLGDLTKNELELVYASVRSEYGPINQSQDLCYLIIDNKNRKASVQFIEKRRLLDDPTPAVRLVKRYAGAGANNTHEKGDMERFIENLGLTGEAAERLIEYDLARITLEPVPSRNKGLHVVTRAGKRLFLKIFYPSPTINAGQKAELETMANFWYARLPQLSSLVPGADSVEYIREGELALAAQNDLSHIFRRMPDPGLDYWIDAYARFATFGNALLAHIEIPNVTPKGFYEVIDPIWSIPHSKLKGLKDRYEDGTAAMAGNTVVLTDTKRDNHRAGKVFDLERLRIGSPINSLPLLFAQYGLCDEGMKHYTHRFMERLHAYGMQSYPDYQTCVCQMYDSTKKAMLPILLCEISGIESRPLTRESRMQRDQLMHHLALD